MRFIIKFDIEHKSPEGLVTWVEAGVYKIERIFDNSRILINVGIGGNRQLTLVPTSRGKIVGH